MQTAKLKALIPFLVIALAHGAAAELMPSRHLMRSTVYIEADNKLGTGFIFAFDGPSSNTAIPVIVTCWHVVSNATSGVIYFAQSPTNQQQRVGLSRPVRFRNFGQLWYRHPDSNVDLAILPLAPVMKAISENGTSIEYKPLLESMISNDKLLERRGVFEDLKFVGYPDGIWDRTNSLPIARRAMAASDPSVDFGGKPQFLLDAAVYPGSSGSPVVLMDEPNVRERSITMLGSPRFELLGVLFAVYQFSIDGKVNIVEIPSAFTGNSQINVPANLGVVVKASQIKAFRSVLERLRPNEGSEGDNSE